MSWKDILKGAGKERKRLFRGINIPLEVGMMKLAPKRIRPNVILSKHAIERMQGKDVSRETDTGPRAGETMYRDLEGVWYFEGAMDAIQAGVESGRFNSILKEKYGKKSSALVRLSRVGHGRMGWIIKRYNNDTVIVATYLDFSGLPQGSGANTVDVSGVTIPLHPINPPRMQSESYAKHYKHDVITDFKMPTQTFREKVTIEAVKIPEFEEKYMKQLFWKPVPKNTMELRSKLTPFKNKSQGSKRDRFFFKLLYDAETKWDF